MCYVTQARAMEAAGFVDVDVAWRQGDTAVLGGHAPRGGADPLLMHGGGGGSGSGSGDEETLDLGEAATRYAEEL